MDCCCLTAHKFDVRDSMTAAPPSYAEKVDGEIPAVRMGGGHWKFDRYGAWRRIHQAAATMDRWPFRFGEGLRSQLPPPAVLFSDPGGLLYGRGRRLVSVRSPSLISR